MPTPSNPLVANASDRAGGAPTVFVQHDVDPRLDAYFVAAISQYVCEELAGTVGNRWHEWTLGSFSRISHSVAETVGEGITLEPLIPALEGGEYGTRGADALPQGAQEEVGHMLTETKEQRRARYRDRETNGPHQDDVPITIVRALQLAPHQRVRANVLVRTLYPPTTAIG